MWRRRIRSRHMATWFRSSQPCRSGRGQRVQVSKVLLTAAVEIDVGVTSARRIDNASNRARRWPRSDDSEGVAAVYRPKPDAPLRSRSGGAAHKDFPEGINPNVWLAVRMTGIDNSRNLEPNMRRTCAGRLRQHR